jgi:5-methylcytosine-specific restriction endonuclease McrA
VDEREVRPQHDDTYQGCGITRHRLRLGGQDLERHSVVPVAAGGHRHEHNLVPLCSYCHRRAHVDD